MTAIPPGARPPAKYPNRSDLATRTPETIPRQAYGEAAQQQRALKAVPMAPPQQQTGMVGENIPAQSAVVPLHEPTQNPQEPLTAGAPFGAGPGPEALGPAAQAQMGQPQDPVRQQVAALYRVNPNPDLLRLLELLDMQGR